jgi:hypothetical protein
MIRLGTFEITLCESKRGEAWWAIWAERDTRAIYQSDEDAEMAAEKGIQAVREMADYWGPILIRWLKRGPDAVKVELIGDG